MVRGATEERDAPPFFLERDVPSFLFTYIIARKIFFEKISGEEEQPRSVTFHPLFCHSGGSETTDRISQKRVRTLFRGTLSSYGLQSDTFGKRLTKNRVATRSTQSASICRNDG